MNFRFAFGAYIFLSSAFPMLSYSLEAKAAEILWITGGWDSTVTNSAYGSCQSFWDEYASHGTPNTSSVVGYKGLKLARKDSLTFYCGATEILGYGGTFERYDLFQTRVHQQPCPNPGNSDPETGICIKSTVTGKTKGFPQGGVCSVAGNPINFSNGNKIESETDYTNNTIALSRYYNSTDGLWRHSFSTHLREEYNSINVVNPDGREVQFIKEGNTYLVAPPNAGKLELLDSGYVYTDSRNNLYYFSSDDELKKINFGGLHQIEIFRNELLLTIKDTNGGTFLLKEDAARQPHRFEAPDTLIDYGYDGSTLRNVKKSFSGQSTTRRYEYIEAKDRILLSRIVDERGIKFAQWSYDALGRAISSEHAGGAQKTMISYNADGSVSVTNELGKVATYVFNNINGMDLIRSITGEPSPNCSASNSSYEYDGSGHLIKAVDSKDLITSYTYNTRGLETTRTEASGTPQARTTTTEWDPNRFLRTKVIEPTRITVYTYDSQGRETGRQVSAR